MSRVCFICGKKSVAGNNISHSHRKTKRTWQANLQLYTIKSEGKNKKVRLCTKCIKKQGK